MHRTKTHFAQRVTRVANALERRGVTATYELHDRVLSNRQSRRLFERDRPVLDEVQRRTVTALETDGYAVVPFQELFPDGEAWASIEAQADQFAAETEAALAGDREGLRVRAGKEFVVRLNGFGAEVGLDDPWFRVCASRRLLDLANSYLGLCSKLEYVDLWYSVPQPEGAERAASQLWHRDYNDKHLLKAFLYLCDVDEETGPFEYVAGSTAGGPYSDLRPWRPGGVGRIPAEEVNGHVPAEAVKTFTAPKGTLILCNTSGLHRGGYTTKRPRVLATVTYSSPASLASLTERNYALQAPPDGLETPVRFALT